MLQRVASYLNVKTISHRRTQVGKMFCIFDGQIGTTLNSADSQAQVSLISRGVNDTLLQALRLARGLMYGQHRSACAWNP